VVFVDDSERAELDLEVWLPHYLPQRSSRAESAATYAASTSPTGRPSPASTCRS